jgi:hypothetical protein
MGGKHGGSSYYVAGLNYQQIDGTTAEVRLSLLPESGVVK